MTDPAWSTEDPQRWSTYWRAGYTIAGAKPVTVETYASSEAKARKSAEEALTEALEKVCELGLSVSAHAWVQKHQSRQQSRVFDTDVVKELETKDWGGRIAVTGKGVEYPR